MTTDPFFTPTGNFVARGADKVNPALVAILQEAADRTGMKVQAYSGYRPGDPRFHGKGKATDVRIIGEDGKEIPNYQSAEGFGAYEKLAQTARKIQMEKYPELADQFRWGGYFSGGKGKYGAMDLMHFDLGGGDGLGMAGGSWDKGLTPQQASLYGIKSTGPAQAVAGAQTSNVPTPSPSPLTAFAEPAQPGNAGTSALNNLVQPVDYKVVPTSRKKIVDPALLEQLNGSSPITSGNSPATVAGRKKVEDPALLAQLNGTKVDPATNQPPGVPAFDPGVAGYDPKTGEVAATTPNDKVGAFLTGVADLPVVGPLVKEGQRDIAAGIAAPFSNSSYSQIREDMGNRQQQVVEDNPKTALAGNVVGTIGTLAPAAATETGGFLLGTAGNSLLGRVGMSAASNGLINAADTAVRGGSTGDVAKNGLIGAGIGGALPGLGAAANAIGRAAVDTVGPRVNALVRPAYEAARRVGSAMTADAKNTAAPVLGAADEASAAINNQSLLNVDRGGETTRALARSAANSDPEARAVIDKTVSDRFSGQSDRAQSFIGRITGGATDDLALQDSLRTAASKANKPAYERAYKAPAAQDMSSPGLMDMLSSPAIRQAAKDAETRGANRAVVDGFNPVRNPFTFDEGGKAALRTDAKPTLQFWDQVKRNLDSQIDTAKRGGDKTLTADLSALKTKLVGELDKAVPEYATARAGASAFFGAEDALDAGRKFVTLNRKNAETAAALAKMTPAERTTFAVGFASEMKDAIAQAPDRTNVIKKIFGSPQARDKIKLALGSKAYGEFEQFVKVENSMDMLRGAMGNSTTARQLAEMGLAGGTVGVGTGLYTGDWKSGVGAAILTGLARRGGAKIDERITKNVAQLLLSDDPAAIQKAVTLASTSSKAAAALEAIQTALSVSIKGMGNISGRPAEKQPLELTARP
jgi:hypothetical protein